jgi:hypothetical protein
MGSMFLDAPGGGGGDEKHQSTVQTLELDGTTVTVDRVDPWHPTFDKGGRLEKKADLGAIMVSVCLLSLFPSVWAILMTGMCFIY